MLPTVNTKIGGGPHVLLFLINAIPVELLQFKAFKSPSFENIYVLLLGGKSSDKKYHLSICHVGLQYFHKNFKKISDFQKFLDFQKMPDFYQFSGFFRIFRTNILSLCLSSSKPFRSVSYDNSGRFYSSLVWALYHVEMDLFFNLGPPERQCD